MTADVVVRQGNVIRNDWPGYRSLEDQKYVNLYLGSGCFGGCFDAYGLMNRPYVNWSQDHIKRMKYSGQWGSARMGNTVFMHADHWSRGTYGLDYHLPLARLEWAEELMEVSEGYQQVLDLYDGRLSTQLTCADTSIHIVSYFNPYHRDIFTMEVSYTSKNNKMPPIRLVPLTEVRTQYENLFQGTCNCVSFDAAAREWTGNLKVGTADTILSLRVLSEEGQVTLEPLESGPELRFEEATGKHTILFGVAQTYRKSELETSMKQITDRKTWSKESIHSWHKRWGHSFLSLPDETLQSLWSRSVYYLLCSYAPDSDCVAPPNGWSGNGWNFHFPQDFSYIHPALLRLGHLDIAQSKVEFYRSRLEDTCRNTKRVFGAEGACWSWEHPIGPDFTILENAAPNVYQFQIHNAAYPARMAYETSLYLNDGVWTNETAWPIVRESARFYLSIMKKEPNGTWGIHAEPSMGQDEAGGFSAGNYLCSLYSAKYCFKAALQLAHILGIENEETALWEKVMEDGMAFDLLYDEVSGLYFSCEEALAEGREMKQKHPVQLNPLTFLPLEELEEPVANAYQKRYQLCYGVNDDFSPGWTLGAYWLAASHMRDGKAMVREFEQILPKTYADKDRIQIYESSGYYWMQYYTTTHGLLLQALNDAIVSDYWGTVEIGSACPPDWIQVKFCSLYTIDGRMISGEKSGGQWMIQEEER